MDYTQIIDKVAEKLEVPAAKLQWGFEQAVAHERIYSVMSAIGYASFAMFVVWSFLWVSKREFKEDVFEAWSKGLIYGIGSLMLYFMVAGFFNSMSDAIEPAGAVIKELLK
jgi:hypothetical protein